MPAAGVGLQRYGINESDGEMLLDVSVRHERDVLFDSKKFAAVDENLLPAQLDGCSRHDLGGVRTDKIFPGLNVDHDGVAVAPGFKPCFLLDQLQPLKAPLFRFRI